MTALWIAIDELHQAWGREAAADTMQRILRVPEALDSLRDDELRRLVIEAGPQLSLTDLVGLARQQAPTDDVSPRLQPLLTVCQQADELASESSGGLLLQTLNPDPVGLRSAMAVALDRIGVSSSTLADLLQSNDSSVRLTAINAVLANLSGPALDEWLGSQPVQSGQLAADLIELGEPALVKDRPSPATGKGTPGGEPHQVEQALRRQAQGDLEGAINLLQEAWERGTEQTAGIAGRLGAAAAAAGDLVLSQQALQRGHDLRPSADRAADLAYASIETGDCHAALTLVNDRHDHRPSLIAAGWANLRLGLPSQARSKFEAAEATAGLLSSAWIARLADGWLALGDMERSIRCLRGHCARRPGDLAARRILVERQLQAGEYAAAVDGASLLAVVEPSDETHALQARALQAAGFPQQALDHWLALLPDVPQAKSMAAECAIEAGDTDTALKLAQELVEADPDSTEARVTMARALIAANNTRAGIAHLRRATELEPQTALTWLALAEAEHDEGDVNRALETLQAAAQACPDDPSIHHNMAAYLGEQERWSEALRASESAYDLDPDDPAAMALHGTLLVRVGLVDEAVPYLEQSIARQPGNWNARSELAQLYETNGQPGQAADLMTGLPDEAPAARHGLAGRLLVRTHPSDPAVATQAMNHLDLASQVEPSAALDYWRGRAYQALGEPSEALRVYQACLKSLADDDPLYDDCLLGQAQAAMDADQTPVAISLLEGARERRNLPVTCLTLLSSAYMTAGLPEEALAPAIDACQMDPASLPALEQVVAAASAAGQTELAIEHLGRIDEQSPADPALQLGLADQYAGLGDRLRARNALAKAIAADRTSAPVLQQAASTLVTLDQPRAAVRLLLSAERHTGSDPSLLRDLARSAAAAGDPELARRVWIELLEVDSHSIEALVGAAEACWQLDQRSASIGYLQRAAANDPTSIDLQTRLARAQLANGESADAYDHYRAALRQHPADQGLRVEAAKALLQQDSPADAVELLMGLPADVKPGLALTTLAAQALLELGRDEEALAQLQSIDPKELGRRQNLLTALARLATDQLGPAASNFETAVAAAGPWSDDQPWALRAAAALGQWETLAGMLPAEPGDLDDAIYSLAACCRLLDAGNLIGVQAEAQGHAPSTATMEAAAAQLAGLTPDLFARLGAGPALQSALETWQTLGQRADTDVDKTFVQNLPQAAWIRGWAHEALALHRLEQADHEGALESLAASPPSTQQGSWGALIAGLAHSAAGRLPMARKAFGAASHGSWTPLAAYLAGRTWAEESRLTEAINNLNSAVVAWPNETHWQSRLAGMYLQATKPEAALPHYQHAVETAPQDPEANRGLARSFAALGQHSEALTHYRRLADQPQAEAHLLTEAAGEALACGEPALASTWYERALAGDSNSLEALLGGARAALTVEDRQAAEKLARRALRLGPDDPVVLTTWAEVLTALDRKEQALAAYDEARQSGDDSPGLEVKRSKLLVRMGRAQDAIAGLKAIVEHDPHDEQSWAALAEAYAASNRTDEAIDALRLALEMRPGSAGHRLNLAQLFRKSGQLDQALDELTKLEQEAAADYRVPLEMGLVHRARRQWGLAQRSFERAIDLRSDSAAAHFHAGMVLKALKSYSQAAAMLQRAVDLNPHDSEALQQLAAVQALALVHGGIQNAAVTS